MMTDVATLAGPQARPEPDRDRWGRYRIPHPETGKVQSWTRATTLAGTIADQFGLTKWKQRMTLYGVAHRADLYAEAASINDADAAKSQLDKLVEAAMEAAGSSSRARLGTALHAFAEQVDGGADITIPAPYDADIAAYRQTMSTAGVQIIPEMIERIVVNIALGVAGTFDRLVNIGGRWYVGDLKTGRDLKYSWHEIAAQLAIYAGADTIYDVTTGEHTPMPEVDQHRGLIMHLPVGEATCTLYWVDLDQGRHAVNLCTQVREWRKVKGLAEKFTVETKPGLLDDPDVIICARPGPAPKRSSDLEAMLDAPPAPVDNPVHISDVLTELGDELLVKRRAWVTGRIMNLPAEAKASLARNWPVQVPTLKASEDHDHEQLSVIAALLSKVEGAFGLEFSDPDPARERRPVDHIDLIRRVTELPADLVDMLGEARNAAGLDKPVRQLTAGELPKFLELLNSVEATRDQRALEVRAMLARVSDDPSDEAVRLMLARTAGFNAGTPDAATENQIAHLDSLVDAIDQGILGVLYGTDGAPMLTVADDTERRLISHAGGKRELLTAMKQTADVYGLPRPRSVAAGMTDLLLVAALEGAKGPF